MLLSLSHSLSLSLSLPLTRELPPPFPSPFATTRTTGDTPPAGRRRIPFLDHFGTLHSRDELNNNASMHRSFLTESEEPFPSLFPRLPHSPLTRSFQEHSFKDRLHPQENTDDCTLHWTVLNCLARRDRSFLNRGTRRLSLLPSLPSLLRPVKNAYGRLHSTD